MKNKNLTSAADKTARAEQTKSYREKECTLHLLPRYGPNGNFRGFKHKLLSAKGYLVYLKNHPS